jgi:hypothetical protein
LIRKLAPALAAALFASTAAAQVPPPPKLVVLLVVDQLTGDLFEQYRPNFGEGFARIASGTAFRNGSEAPGPALGDLVKARAPGSRNVDVSGEKSQVSDALSGRNLDQRWYWNANKFDTDVRSARVPAVVPKVNAAIAAALGQPRPPLEPTSFCKSKPSKTQLARRAGDAAGLSASPELDGGTLALAAGLADEMQLGRRADPDVMTIELSATANVVRTYGPGSQEACLQLTELDREIGDFLSLLDSREIDYAVALQGGGGAPIPILLWRPGFRGATVAAPASTADLTATLATLIDIPLANSSGHCLEGTPAFCPQR